MDRCRWHSDHGSKAVSGGATGADDELRGGGGSGVLRREGAASASIAPAMRSNIPVAVLNSRNPDGKGTEIVAHPGDECVMKAITAKKGVTVVDVQAVRWLAPELLREIFEVFVRHQDSLDLLSASLRRL